MIKIRRIFRMEKHDLILFIKKKETTSRRRKEKEKRSWFWGKVENSNERLEEEGNSSGFLNEISLSQLCIWGSVDKALPSLRQLMTQSGSGWLSLYKGVGYTRGRTSQCAECTCLAAFINTVARTQLRTSERERIPRRVLHASSRFVFKIRSFNPPLPFVYTCNYRDSSLRRD